MAFKNVQRMTRSQQLGDGTSLDVQKQMNGGTMQSDKTQRFSDTRDVTESQSPCAERCLTRKHVHQRRTCPPSPWPRG